MITMPLEADTRFLIDKSLENLGWSFEGKDQNVFCERPRTEAERKKLRGKRPDYVLYSKEDDKPLIIIEAKKKGERIDTALEQGVYYARELGAPIVFATDGLFCKSYHTKFDKPPILNGEEVDEFVREALALKYLNTWEVNTISSKVQYDRKELIKIFDEANNMLRGDGLRAGIERFGEFANILFLKLISESEDFKKLNGKLSDFNDMCHWDYIKNLKPASRIDHINKIVYEKLNALYKTDIFTPLSIRDTSILKDIMDKLDPLTLTDVDSDVKGDAFEYFLKESAATKNDLGEYFTPRHIVKTMVKLVNPQIGERVYDPFCGTGGFLIESFRHIYNTMPRNATTEKMLREQTIYGNEITNTARITKMNMILAGDGHSGIQMKDSLANPVKGEYDIVLANMPYSQKTKYGSFYDLPSKNGDSICVQHCMKAINCTAENGRMALVVPEGFLFRKDLAKAREYMLDNCQLQSIISLPQGVFLPYTGVKTNIIYATKVNHKPKSADKRNDFWYFDVKSDGYTLDNHRRKLPTANDLDKYQEYRKLDNDQKQEMLNIGFEIIPLDKVRANSSILVGSRYREIVASSKYDTLKFEQFATLTRGVTYSKANQSMLKTNTVILPADNITLSGELVMNKPIYLDETFSVSAEKQLKKEDIFICMSSGSKEHIGKVAYIKEDTNYYAGGFMGIIRTNPHKCLPKYLYFYLSASVKFREEIKLLTQGANINNISSSINVIQIPLPSINKQSEIVEELDGYQKVIDGAKAIVEGYKASIPKNVNGELKKIEEIAIINPSKGEVKFLNDDTLVSFVPMTDMNAHNVSFTARQDKKIKEVIKGYTYFKDNDVLLAKITPCFENGKAGVARELKNGVGFGSTEYIVIRANSDVVYPEWIYYHINSQDFLSQGKGFMTGTAGQQRIDINFVKEFSLIVPSLAEQRRILDEIKAEQLLIEPSEQLIKLFSKKIRDRVNELFE